MNFPSKAKIGGIIGYESPPHWFEFPQLYFVRRTTAGRTKPQKKRLPNTSKKLTFTSLLEKTNCRAVPSKAVVAMLFGPIMVKLGGELGGDGNSERN